MMDNSIVSNSEVVKYICGQEDGIDLKIDSSRMHCMSRINSSDGDYLASILSQPFPLQWLDVLDPVIVNQFPVCRFLIRVKTCRSTS